MPEPQKIFVSYTQADRVWAEWIAWQLKEAGHEPVLQAWHFGAGSDFVVEMQKAVRETSRTIAVLSPEYERSAFAMAEWAGIFVQDPTGEGRKLVPVRVEPYKPTGLLASKVYIDLVDAPQEAARERLLAGLRGPGPPDRTPRFPDRNHSAKKHSANPDFGIRVTSPRRGTYRTGATRSSPAEKTSWRPCTKP